MNNTAPILVVDDEADLRHMIKMTLASKGHAVETADNGLDALSRLDQIKPSLIILDMNMPKMGGIEFYQRICDKEGHPRHPVLVLTARANMEQLFKTLNIDGFMAKPFEVDDLLKEVDAIMHKSSTGPVSKTPTGLLRKICIVENDTGSMSQIGGSFVSAGYCVIPASNGMEGVERIYNNIPDIALVNLRLDDIAGDMVILKLRQMPKTHSVRYILYTQKSPEKTMIASKIGAKEGIERFVEFSQPQDLVDAVFEILGRS